MSWITANSEKVLLKLAVKSYSVELLNFLRLSGPEFEGSTSFTMTFSTLSEKQKITLFK